MKDLGYRLRHWWWSVTHPGQWMASRRYARTAGKTPPREFWEWRPNDAIADEEIRTGKVRRFDNVQDALAWLNSDDHEGED